MVDAINDLDDMLDNVDENGKHKAQLTAIRFQNGRDGRNWVIFKFEVTDPNDPVEGEEYERWVQDWSHLTTEDYNALDGKAKSRVRTAKKRMLENFISVGYSEEEAKVLRKNPKDDSRSEALGRQVWITVQTSDRNNQTFKNITDVQPMTDDDESNNAPF